MTSEANTAAGQGDNSLTGANAQNPTWTAAPEPSQPRVNAAARAQLSGVQPRRRWARLVLLGVVAFVAVWLVAGAVVLFGAKSDADAGAAALAAARKDLRAPAALKGDAAPDAPDPVRDLATAQARLRDATAAIDSVWVLPYRWLPVAGRQLQAVRAMTAGGAQIAQAGGAALGEVRTFLPQAAKDPAQRPAAMARLAEVAQRTLAAIADVPVGPSHALVAPVAARHQAYVADLARLRATLTKGQTVTAGLASFLAGPTHYLVIAANNAEMRGGQGMFLQAGTMNVAAGDVSVNGLASVDEVRVPPGVPLDPDFAKGWGFDRPAEDFRTIGWSPRFDMTAALAARMWEASGRPPVDGVIVVDPAALAMVLEVTGPVSFGGTELSAGYAQEFLLHDQYLAAGDDAAAQDARREKIGAIAQAVLSGLRGGSWSLSALGARLADAAGGRHLLAWSKVPAQQQAWVAAGLGGVLAPDSLLVAVQNDAGNKLDWFTRVGADLSVERAKPSRGADGNEYVPATLRVTVENAAPATGEPAYVQGPGPKQLGASGEYVGYVSVNLPAIAGNVSTNGAPVAVDAPDGPTSQVAVPVRVPRGETKVVTLTFLVPSSGSVTVLPSARVPATSWSASVDGQTSRWTDEAARQFTW